VKLDDIVGNSISGFRLIMRVFLAFASTALLLAAVGLYGLMSYAVSQRTYEISVRMAIGAPRTNVIRLVLNQSLRIAGIGTAAGTIAALLLSRWLSGILTDMKAPDPTIFAAVALLILVVTLIASSVPAWRAMHIDPVRTLRSE
jgi:ABC-type antimicrobial peptide transport system permease subunit